MTNDKQQQKIGINPNPTMVALTETEELNADLTEARLQIATIKSERDQLASKITQLDIEIAHLKDAIGRQSKINDNLLDTFKELYAKHQDLYDQIITSNTALTITAGKLSESLVRSKFTIPQAEQQQT